MLTRRTVLAAGFAVPALSQNRIVDDTAALQRAIDALPNGGVLDGANRSFNVRSLRLKSHITFQNYKLQTIPTSAPLTAPVTIDGQRVPVEDVTIRNVSIIGNRKEQTNLYSAEDGGRDGFRIVGRARHVRILDCSAEHCGTDGLKIFSADALSGDDSRLNFDDITVERCRFNWNRRQGISGDAMRNVVFRDCELSHNGIDVPGARTEGDKGALDSSGILYGAGVDIEGYGVGCGVENLSFINCTALGNARFGIQFWEPADPRAPKFVPRRNIRIEQCRLDGGVSPRHARQAIEFSLPPKNRARGTMYEDIRIQDCTIQGTIVLHGVRGATISGGSVKSPFPDYWGSSERSTGITIQNVTAEGKRFINR